MNWALTAAIISAVFAGIGLILNWLALRENNKTRQLQLLNDIFRSIKETEATLYKEYKNADSKTRREWDSLLFNSIEQFAFLVNERFIRDKKIASFFDDAVIMWYEQIFLKHHSANEINDKRIYPELKKLYSVIKLKQQNKKDNTFKDTFLIMVAAYAGAFYSVFVNKLLTDYSNLVNWIGFGGANFVLFGAVWILIGSLKEEK